MPLVGHLGHTCKMASVGLLACSGLLITKNLLHTALRAVWGLLFFVFVMVIFEMLPAVTSVDSNK